MGRTKIWDAQLSIKWLSSWLERLKIVAASSEEDIATIARTAIEREIEKREKKLGVKPTKE